MSPAEPAGPSPSTAAALIVGDELLTGKVRDENGFFIAQFLRRCGIRLVEQTIVGDDPTAIGAALRRLWTEVDIVITSGGVGPTHDDVTLSAIAQATGRPLRRHPELERSLREHYGAKINEAALAMADVPLGTQLRAGGGWPVLRLDVPVEQRSTRIYILPGVPSLLRSKLEQLERIEGELPRGAGWVVQVLHTTLDESKLAPVLDATQQTFSAVTIGSYPRWVRDAEGKIQYHARITFEADVDRVRDVEAARAQVEEALGPDALCDPAQPL